ncbi:ferrous iron transporter B [Halodesulfurarchaeum sp. HSR-GB]|uniref:ferrous iron transporter B n=1 Tax=Halodesulfurarchaeum sp. HSR-GB TaxID=3074077 RepID=UPI00285C9874|nr:ferrous iron transporter B [Halodesulfurarchaeum sp. HSR-GB]MDR5656952.1 ferrous iron transporter B [Halodesulfurarchaeum sp. HSR-GB]
MSDSPILLMGHPNVGKSAMFNRLAGADITESNYPGTTVDYTESDLAVEGTTRRIIDVPGTFSLDPKDSAESVAVDLLDENPDATVVCVLDATRIERGLNLAVEILERGYDLIVALNMWDEAASGNIDIDVDELSSVLDVPVVPTVATEGTGIKALIDRLPEANPTPIESVLDAVGFARAEALDSATRWDLVDAIVDATVEYGETEPTLPELIGTLTVKPWTGLPFALAALYGMWAFFSAVAGFFTDGYFVPLFDAHWLPWLQETFPFEGTWLYFILVGDPAATNSFEAFGMLTSGLFVAIGVVLPAVFALYLVLAVLEDSGYMARLAVLLDTIFHKIGLHGFAIVPMVLSFGCNVPGVAATRSFETEKQRFVMMTLLSVFIPCGAQLAVMLSLIPQYTGFIVLYLLAGFFVFGAILDKLVPGSSPELIVDVPPLREPRIGNIATKLTLRTREFLKSAVPFVLLGVGIINVLYLGGAIEWLAGALEPVLTGWFGVPTDTIPALIAGFLRKDLAVAQLSAISMTPFQTVMSVIMVSIYFPCLATFAMLIKEGSKSGGVVKMLGGALLTLVAALFLWGGLFHLGGILTGVA